MVSRARPVLAAGAQFRLVDGEPAPGAYTSALAAGQSVGDLRGNADLIIEPIDRASEAGYSRAC